MSDRKLICDFFGWRRFRETDSRIPKFPQSFRNVSDLSRCEIHIWNGILEWRHADRTWFFYYRDKIGGKFSAISHLHLWNEKKDKCLYSTWESTSWIVCHEENVPCKWFCDDSSCSRVGNRTTFLYFNISNLSFSFSRSQENFFFPSLTARTGNKYTTHTYEVIKTHRLNSHR